MKRPTCRAKSFNSIKLAFLHFCLFPTFYNWYRFTSMDLVWPDAVSIQVPNTFHYNKITEKMPFPVKQQTFKSLFQKGKIIFRKETRKKINLEKPFH